MKTMWDVVKGPVITEKVISNVETGGHGTFTAATQSTQPPNMPDTPNVTMFDVLKVFLAGQHSKWRTAWQVGTINNGLNVFFNRGSDILPNLSHEQRAMLIEMLTAGQRRNRKTSCRCCHPSREPPSHSSTVPGGISISACFIEPGAVV